MGFIDFIFKDIMVMLLTQRVVLGTAVHVPQAERSSKSYWLNTQRFSACLIYLRVSCVCLSI